MLSKSLPTILLVDVDKMLKKICLSGIATQEVHKAETKESERLLHRKRHEKVLLKKAKEAQECWKSMERELEQI